MHWILEFVAAKFILNLTFVQLFVWFVLTKNKNLYNVLEHKIYNVFWAKIRICSHENVTNF